MKPKNQPPKRDWQRLLDQQSDRIAALEREAQIEEAMEWIRVQAMSMNNSGDLIKVATVLREQMGNLGQYELESCIVHLYDLNHDMFQAWWAFRLPEDKQGKVLTGMVHLPFEISRWSQEIKENYLSEARSYTIESRGEMIREWYSVMEEHAPQTVMYTAMGEPIVPEVLYYHFSKFSGGALLTITTKPPLEETRHLQFRAAGVFEMAYRRFLDLHKAEAQAREARKQASLDRVRGQIASMRSTEDLQRITPLIWNELTILGVPFIRCGVFIINEAQERVQAYLSTPDGQALAALNISFDANPLMEEAVAHWQRNEIYQNHWTREDFIQWTQSMIRQGQISDQMSYQGADRPPESLYLYFIPFTQGMLYVGNVAPLIENQITWVHSLAETFAVAYARYEDFSQLEKAKSNVETTLSELKAAQAQLIQSEKMASLGELTAGIAHEIQNPLNFVNNFSQVSGELLEEMGEALDEGDTAEVKEIIRLLSQNLGKINHHGERASGIVKGMLQHSRSKPGEKEPTDINALADEYLRLAYHGMRARDKLFNVKMETLFDEKLSARKDGSGKIRVIPQDMGRVMLNLITNAFHACTARLLQHRIEQSGPSRQKKEKGFVPFVSIGTKKEEDRVIIEIRDNGTGIPKDIVNKIFQPFFTTKPTGQGTGLGLSLSYDIVKAHGGTLEIETKEGEGSLFRVLLPLDK